MTVDLGARLCPRLEDARVEHLKNLQEEIFTLFREWVLSQRGSKLKGAHEELFSGAFWTGVKAKELGLIDGLGELREIMQDRFGEDVLFKNYAPKTGILSKLGLGSESVSGISKDFTIKPPKLKLNAPKKINRGPGKFLIRFI